MVVMSMDGRYADFAGAKIGPLPHRHRYPLKRYRIALTSFFLASPYDENNRLLLIHQFRKERFV